ncbi:MULTISPECIES: class I SAM-dependent methyltransferase [Saccharibacillus]|uniref:class I SAM-dependent methyltransferase n=1 Tax=Saccharibacillus TaxID=456492 RepID=UPI001312E64B|nr:methyltransferase domain-containing protein [Saccharibacillus sp. WB 17]MWJ31637.1 methyltransferase domain-containing protein [Saccharibacillus sp. WB 17]
MFDSTRFPGDGEAGSYSPPRTEDGFVYAIRPQQMRLSNARAMALYDRIARFHAVANRLYLKLRFGGEIHYRWTFLSQLDVRRGERVLEVSVGTGGNLPLLPAGAHLYGLDLSPAMLRQAARHLREWGTEAELIHGEAEHLPFRGDTFDCVYHIGGLSEFGDPALALREMIRVAKSGTRILVADEVDRRTRARRPRISLAKPGDLPRPDVLRMLPAGMLDVRYEEVCKGLMYRLTFRKP